MDDESNTDINFEVIKVSTIGASHLKAGLPCEDFGIVYNDGEITVFAVADGHGDSNCPRSSYGSRVACEIACAELAKFSKDASEATYSDENGEDQPWERRLFDPLLASPTIKQLALSIVGNWRDDVLEDLERNPLTKEERAMATGYISKYDRGERLEHIYGTTLIAGLATKCYLLLIQQGDGRCVVFSKDGLESQPVPWDEACFANVTTSLCDEDAVESLRFYIRDLKQEPIAACFAGTDGVEDSFFSMEQLHAFYRNLLIAAAKDSVNECEAQLAKSLPEFSAKGSGDDVTICGIIQPKEIERLIPILERRSAMDDARSELSRIEDRLQSMRGKLDFLNERRIEAEEALDNAAREAKGAWDNRDACAKDNEILGDGKGPLFKGLSKRFQEWVFNGAIARLDEAEEKLQSAQQTMREATEASERARTEYESYLASYEKYLARRDELTMQLDETQNAPETSGGLAIDFSTAEECNLDLRIPKNIVDDNAE